MPENATSTARPTAAEQACALLKWAELAICDGVFRRGDVPELMVRLGRLLYTLAQEANGHPDYGGEGASLLWAFFAASGSLIDPGHANVHRAFIDSFDKGEPTYETRRYLWRAGWVTKGPPDGPICVIDRGSWTAAKENGMGGPDAVAELLRAVRGIAKVKAKGKRGRPSNTDHKRDAQISEAWQSSQHRTHAGLARELGIKEGEVKLALERVRNRERRAAVK